MIILHFGYSTSISQKIVIELLKLLLYNIFCSHHLHQLKVLFPILFYNFFFFVKQFKTLWICKSKFKQYFWNEARSNPIRPMDSYRLKMNHKLLRATKCNFTIILLYNFINFKKKLKGIFTILFKTRLVVELAKSPVRRFN